MSGFHDYTRSNLYPCTYYVQFLVIGCIMFGGLLLWANIFTVYAIEALAWWVNPCGEPKSFVDSNDMRKFA